MQSTELGLRKVSPFPPLLTRVLSRCSMLHTCQRTWFLQTPMHTQRTSIAQMLHRVMFRVALTWVLLRLRFSFNRHKKIRSQHNCRLLPITLCPRLHNAL